MPPPTPSASTKPARVRAIRPPSEVAKSAILKMPIGQLNAMATELIAADRATAEYLSQKLVEALGPSKP